MTASPGKGVGRGASAVMARVFEKISACMVLKFKRFKRI
jgi:hypothetical protein